MELLRKEMERVGLNNNNNNKKELGKEEERERGGNSNSNSNSNKNNNEQQKTMLRTPADIFDHPSFYSFVLDMPGLDALNIKVRVENGILHVTGKKKKQQMGEGVKVIRVERRRARYMRKFTLPNDATHEDVKATYKDGVLSITVSKNLNLSPQVEHFNIDSNSPTTNVSIS